MSIHMIALGLLLLLAGGPSHAQIQIKSTTNMDEPSIVIRSLYDFEKDLSLKVKTDPRLIPTEKLIKMVREIGMEDENGIKISEGFDIDLENDLVLGFSGGKSEIINTARLPKGFRVVASFKNHHGQFVSPASNSLGVYSTGGQKYCFSYQPADPPKMAFALLLDRSGSMGGVIGDVKTAATRFLNLLPSTALCAVGSFNTGFSYAHQYYQSCGAGGFGFESITAEGGTDIYAPLKAAYETLSGSFFDGYQKAVIIISDGYTLSDAARKAQLMALKKDVLTFVYFIGGDNKNELVGLTDQFITEGGDLKASLAQYFKVLSGAYAAQKVLKVSACPSNTGGTP